MERLDKKEINLNPILLPEHQHRYLWASNYCYGNVLDVGCGTGYGSKIVSKIGRVKSYTGIDYSKKTILQAHQHYGAQERIFKVGSAYKIPFSSNNFDTVICIETLEHLNNPDAALKEIWRTLKKDGIFIGTIPTKEFDIKSRNVYGPNPHHKTQFSEKILQRLLSKYFRFSKISNSSLEIFSYIRNDLDSKNPNVLGHFKNSKLEPLGSYLFLASNLNIPKQSQDKINHAYHAISLVEYDELIRKSIKSQAKLINSRDNTINSQAKRIDERDKTVNSQAKRIDEKDKTVKSQAKRIDERDKTVNSQAKRIDEKDKTVKSQAKRIDEKDKTVKSQAKRIDEKDKTVKSQAKLIDEKDKTLKSQAKRIDERDKTVKSQAKLIDERDSYIRELEKKFNEIIKSSQANLK